MISVESAFYFYWNLAILLEYARCGEPSLNACRSYALQFMPECRKILNPSVRERVPIDRLLHPHLVIVGYGSENDIQWKCGSSLIHPSWVLTASHCLEDPESGPAKRLRIGTATFEFDETEDLIQERNVGLRIQHPEYRPPSKYNDIALLKADEPFELSRDIRLACLPNHINNDQLRNLTAIGFGTTKSGSSKGSLTLMKVTVDLIPREACNTTMKGLIMMGALKDGLIDSQLCAGDFEHGGRDTCQGDSGGPLEIMPQYPDCRATFPLATLIGVTSFGRHCGFKKSPGVYTSVKHFITWIENIVWPTSGQPELYNTDNAARTLDNARNYGLSDSNNKSCDDLECMSPEASMKSEVIEIPNDVTKLTVVNSTNVNDSIVKVNSTHRNVKICKDGDCKTSTNDKNVKTNGLGRQKALNLLRNKHKP